MLMINNNLRIFITVAELSSLTEAAKKLYVSQPAISHAIRKLEDELGVSLFIRTPRNKLILTDAGKDILLTAYKMADLEKKLYQRAYDEKHLLEGTIRIATIPVGISLILAHVLPYFKKQYPSIKIELIEGNPQKVKNLVREFAVDLGISTSPYPGLEHRPLLSDRMVSISREGENVDLTQDTSDLILCQVAHDYISENLSGENIDLSHCIIVQAASTQINMIERGNGRGAISELMLSTIPNSLVRGTVLPNYEMEMGLIAPSFEELTPGAAEMAEMITERSLVSEK